MPLKERVYHCSSCGMSLDRDLNAAINLSRMEAEDSRYTRRVNGEMNADQ